MSVLPISLTGERQPPSIGEKERDFLLLNIFVLSQHGYLERAGILAEAMYVLGDGSQEVLLARAILRFFDSDWTGTLTCLEELDRIDPTERFGSYKLTDRQRMRRYLKARCLYELDDRGRARDALDIYLRHGDEGDEEPG